MTDYTRVTVESPEEAFDRLREEFYVEEETDEGLTIVHEKGEHPIKDDPLRNLIESEFNIEEYAVVGQGIRFQSDLPEELRDEEEYQAEQARRTAAGNLTDRPQEEFDAVYRVLEHIKDAEADSDHVDILDIAQERLVEIYGSEPRSEGVSLSEEDVETALTVLEEEGVEYSRETATHPNRHLWHALGFVQNYASRDLHNTGFPQVLGDSDE